MSEQTEGAEVLSDDGPECDTCGKTTCSDAALPAFSEPRDCIYAPIFHELRDAKDCDYGCARDYTNQAVRLWLVPVFDAMLAAAEARGAERALREAAEALDDHSVCSCEPDHHVGFVAGSDWLRARAAARGVEGGAR